MCILYITGITGTVKAIIAESSVTSNQQALGLSVVAASWGVGLIVGPAVGGALSDPINQFNLNISSMHARGICLINMNSSHTVVVRAVFLLPPPPPPPCMTRKQCCTRGFSCITAGDSQA